MSKTSPNIRTTSPSVDSKTFQNFIRGTKKPNVWTLNVISSQDLSIAMDHLRLNMKVSFGVGPNSTLYIIDDSNPTDPVMSYYNLPLTISYNEYLNEVSVCEYFSTHKFVELDRLVKLEVEEFNFDDVSEFNESDQFHIDLRTQFLKQFSESDEPYVDLNSWVQEQKESTETHEFFNDCNTIWARATIGYKSPTQLAYIRS